MGTIPRQNPRLQSNIRVYSSINRVRPRKKPVGEVVVEESKPLIEPATDEEIKVVLKKIKEDLTSERPLSPLKVR